MALVQKESGKYLSRSAGYLADKQSTSKLALTLPSSCIIKLEKKLTFRNLDSKQFGKFIQFSTLAEVVFARERRLALFRPSALQESPGPRCLRSVVEPGH